MHPSFKIFLGGIFPGKNRILIIFYQNFIASFDSIFVKSLNTNFFNFADHIEKEMRKIFNIPDEKETRLWNRYSINTYEQLTNKDSTVQDAGLYNGQVINFCTLIRKIKLSFTFNVITCIHINILK